MNKLIRVFSYILMILGAVILLGGFGTGIFMLCARGVRAADHAQPFFRMMDYGPGVMMGLRTMLQGLLVSGFGMLLYLVEQLSRGDKIQGQTLTAKTRRT